MDKGIGKTECNQITQDNSEKAVDVAASFFAQIFFVALSLSNNFLCRALILTWRWLLEGQRDKERLNSQPRTKEETTTLG